MISAAQRQQPQIGQRDAGRRHDATPRSVHRHSDMVQLGRPRRFNNLDHRSALSIAGDDYTSTSASALGFGGGRSRRNF
jgi:hypothetical protein